MSEQPVTLLPDKLAERKQQIAVRIDRTARTRLEASRVIETLDAEMAGLEARYAEIVQCERTWAEHAAILEARQGDGPETGKDEDTKGQ